MIRSGGRIALPFLVAYNSGPHFSYFPLLAEMLITISIVSFEILAYILFVRMLSVLHRTKETKGPGAYAMAPAE